MFIEKPSSVQIVDKADVLHKDKTTVVRLQPIHFCILHVDKYWTVPLQTMDSAYYLSIWMSSFVSIDK